MNRTDPVIVAITGASGSLYGIRLLKALLAKPLTVHLIVSDAGKAVMAHEIGPYDKDIIPLLKANGVALHPQAQLHHHSPGDLFAPPASGSFLHGGMVIAPCSMKTLAAITAGLADDLIHRSADVCLKERRPLILLPRETPLSLVHLENMVRAARAGATILPPAPGFYFRPETIQDLVDSIVARVLDHLGQEHTLTKRWGDNHVV
jgi:4-hydroxy-3-polyprenylbenzoate decarboxylase